jgi:hypothetical protein
VVTLLMVDKRLPITIKKLPGGYRLQFADGKSSLMIYGADSSIAHASGSLSTEEAAQLAKEVADILSKAWGATPVG